jgi:hypothetical protein
MYTPDTCKEAESPKVCALVRKDKICLKKMPRSKPRKIRNREPQYRSDIVGK